MKSVRSLLATALAALITTAAHATWTADAQVNQLNIGGNGLHGTFVSLTGVTFAGCSVNNVAFLGGSSPNYKEFVAALFLAKASERQVRFNYVCGVDGYPQILEILVT